MILKVNKLKTHYLKGLNDFVKAFNTEQWMKDNIHLYEELLSDDEGAFQEIIKDYCSSQNGLYSIIKVGNGLQVSCYEIPFYVITGRKVLTFNSFQKAKDAYCKIAEKKLKEFACYINYPKDKISFDVLESMIKNENLKLILIKNS